MTQTPPSSTMTSNTTPGSATTQSNHSNQDNYRIVRKRNRIPLSCAPCRHRKLKCNRQHPCENCVKRGGADTCTYASTPAKTRSTANGDGDKFSSEDMQNRIDRLESLVLSLMGSDGSPTSTKSPPGKHSSEPTFHSGKDEQSPMDVEDSGSEGTQDTYDMVKEEPDDEIEDVRSQLGFMKVDKNTSFYRGNNHWAVVLSEIAEVKGYFQTHQKQFEELHKKQESLDRNYYGGNNFPFTSARHLSQDDILAMMPPREQVDILVDHWMANLDKIYHVIHCPTFQREYADFWNDPKKANMVWVGFLFALMVVSMNSIEICEIYPAGLKLPEDAAPKFKYACEQALVAGRFSVKPTILTIQALLTYFYGVRHGMDEPWLLLGYIIRIAYSMGLHRDSRKFNCEMPFYSLEMRKRLWCVLACTDTLYSIKLGLPCMIRPREADMGWPSNIHDYEFGVDMMASPVSRPPNEQTPMSYTIAKARITMIFAKIINTIEAIYPVPPYDDVFRLEKELIDAHDAIPHFLKFKPIEQSEMDPPWLITQRFGLDVVFQKSRLVLHRPYFGKKLRCSVKYEPSRRACLESAMALLSHQSVLIDAQDGVLKMNKFAVQTMSVSDILPATMIIMMELWFSSKETDQDAPTFVISPEYRERMLKELDRAVYIYKTLPQSYELAKACIILENITVKLRENLAAATVASMAKNFSSPPDVKDSVSPSSFASPPHTTDRLGDNGRSLEPEQSAAMTLGMMSTGALSPMPMNIEPSLVNQQMPLTSQPLNGNVQSLAAPNDFSSIGYFAQGYGMNIDSGNNVDWDEWDSFLQGVNLDTTNQPLMNLPMTPMNGPSSNNTDMNGTNLDIPLSFGSSGLTPYIFGQDPPSVSSDS